MIATVSSVNTDSGFISGIYQRWGFLFTDILPTNLTCVLPNAVSWVYRSFLAQSIHVQAVYAKATSKVAHLFFHGHICPKRNGDVSAVLFLHGDHSHPLTMLHLGDIAEAKGKTVFSVHLPYDDEHPEEHRALLTSCIDKIEEMVRSRGGRLSNLLLVGHSRGALCAANEAYVENNRKVSGVIAIAGRFKVIEPSERPCRPSLQKSVHRVWQKLRHFHEQLRVPFYQLAAKYDWCTDLEASIVRKDEQHTEIDAGHLGILKHPDTLRICQQVF